MEKELERSIQKSREESTNELKGEGKAEKNKNFTTCIVGVICFLLIFYLGMTKFYSNHYYFGSEINSVNVSEKTMDEAKTIVASQLQEHTITLKERDGKIEYIKGSDINLRYSSDAGFYRFKESQNPLYWFLEIFSHKNSKTTVDLLYDEELLKKQIDGLSCFDYKNIVEPKNPSFQYLDNSYIVVDEVQGNKVDKEKLYMHLVDKILNEDTKIDLEAMDCYVKPEYTSRAPMILEVKDVLNKYVSSKVTYTFGNKKEIIDGDIINQWTTVNENFQVIIDEKKIKNYLEELFKSYNTVGKTRSFAGSSGKVINVGGGDYGWCIDTVEEAKKLMMNIREGKTITKEPAYSQVAFSHGSTDIGNTYVEIDIGKQHIWFYKNGSLIVDGPIVTGDVKRHMTTPKGIYRLKYKAKHVVLRGPGYAAPVTFWMPFNRGIGLHDANWRSSFGGKIYRTNGSHGCINLPYNVAKKIFNNIEVNTPVVCY